MPPRPTPRPGLLAVPGPDVTSLAIRFARLADRDNFAPQTWPQHAFSPDSSNPGWWQFDLDALALADGVYEYEFVASGGTVVPDPYADSITRFGGYRGLFAIRGGVRVSAAFDWTDEFSPGVTLPQNNQIVIYEMPIKWMSSDPAENNTLVELGTLDKVIFEHLDDLIAMGVNCIELLPIEDSPQTLNWGYGTRFFFAPDYDVGGVVDAKFFVKRCHQRGLRVFLDVVMNMCPNQCPLTTLAPSWFYTSDSSRNDYSQNLFLYNTPSYDNYFAAREFHCEMAEFWVSEYHIDGYRIDDFKDINNWDFVQEFHDRAAAKSQSLFPNKPFWVIAEDSNRNFATTGDNSTNPNGRKVVDAIWNFGFRDEIRCLLTNSIDTVLGQASRSSRVAHLISNAGVWNQWPPGEFDPGFADMACSVPYITSHDVQGDPRLMNFLLSSMLPAAGLGDGGVASVKAAVDGAPNSTDANLHNTVQAATQRVFGGFAILMTSVGIPMFLAGEEFGDVHDFDYNDVNLKQEDPVQWQRSTYAANSQLKANVSSLIRLRTSHPALQRNEVTCFYFHPQFDDNDAPRVFAYCRTGGMTLGNPGQVVVIANMGPQSYPVYNIPGWPWNGATLTEVGYPAALPTWNAGSGMLSLALAPFAVRVFQT